MPSKRDPLIDPREGDEVTQPGGSKVIIIDGVTPEWVMWRITDGQGGLIDARRCTPEQWRSMGERERSKEVPS